MACGDDFVIIDSKTVPHMWTPPEPKKTQDTGEWIDLIRDLGGLSCEPVQISGFKKRLAPEGDILINEIPYRFSLLGKGSFKEAYVARITELGKAMLQERAEEGGAGLYHFPVGAELVIAHQKHKAPQIHPSTLELLHSVPGILVPRPVLHLNGPDLEASTDSWQISDYCSEGDCATFIDSLEGTSGLAKKEWIATHRDLIFGMLVHQLTETHKVNIALRDIKLQNIFVSRKVTGYTFHLADHDLCNHFSLQKEGTKIDTAGSPLFMSKECWRYSQDRALKNTPEYRAIIYDNDVWALGIAMYELLNYCESPFVTGIRKVRKIHTKVDEPDWGYPPQEKHETCEEFLQWMLTSKQENRPTTSELWEKWTAVNPALAHRIETRHLF